MLESAQTLQGITECKGFGFVVRPPRAIVSSNAYYFLVVVIQDHEPTSAVAILGATVELDMDMGSFGETGTGLGGE
jgi:hypothetical protein